MKDCLKMSMLFAKSLSTMIFTVRPSFRQNLIDFFISLRWSESNDLYLAKSDPLTYVFYEAYTSERK